MGRDLGTLDGEEEHDKWHQDLEVICGCAWYLLTLKIFEHFPVTPPHEDSPLQITAKCRLDSYSLCE